MKLKVFLNISLILTLIAIYSCSGNNSRAKKSRKSQNNNQTIVQEKLDTVIHLTGQSYTDYSSHNLDTSFIYKSTRYRFRVQLDVMSDTVCYDERPFKENNKIHINRYTGPNIKYSYELCDSLGKRIWKKEFDKRFFTPKLGSIVAQSNPILPEFHNVFQPTREILLIQNFGVPDSDVGVQGSLYFSLKGTEHLKFNSWYGSSNSDCELSYNSDSSIFLTCTEFKNSKGKTFSLELDSLQIGGTLLLDNKFIFACYDDYDLKKRTHARIYDSNGKLLKKFKYEGLTGALGYVIPFYFYEPLNMYYFVDENLECFHIITLNGSVNVSNTPFRKVKKVINESLENKTIEISTEINNHLISVNKSGEIVAHQIQVDENERKFFDDLNQ